TRWSPKPRTPLRSSKSCRNWSWPRLWAWTRILSRWEGKQFQMPEETSNPLLSLIKERSLIDDLQYEEVLAEFKRSGAEVFQILQDFGILDRDTILQVMAAHLGTQVAPLRDGESSPDLVR